MKGVFSKKRSISRGFVPWSRKDEPESNGVGEASDSEKDVVLPSDVLERVRSNLTDHKVGEPAADAGQSSTLCSDRCVHDLHGHRPGQRPDSGREEEVEDPDHSNEGTASMLVEVRAIGGESSLKSGGNSETGTGHGVADNKRLTTTKLVDEKDAGTFTEQCDDRVDTLKEEDLGVRVAKDLENLRSVVLNGGNTGDLDGELKDDTDHDFSDVLLAVEDLAPATGGTSLDG